MKHIDHIDPSWAEGRDYQLVCGLDIALNYAERDPSLNISKSNRFLPWRWSIDELGTVPQEPGDLCLFLDPDSNEWSLQEFMGEWWFAKSKRYDAKVVTKIGQPRPDVSARNSASAGVPKGLQSQEHRDAVSRALKGRVFSADTRAKMSASAQRRAASPLESERRSAVSKQTAAKNSRGTDGKFIKKQP
jgi:hypothetical protein